MVRKCRRNETQAPNNPEKKINVEDAKAKMKKIQRNK